MNKKEFLTSFMLFLPLGAILSYINYDVASGNATKAIVFGYLGAVFIFFIPLLIRKLQRKKSKE